LALGGGILTNDHINLVKLCVGIDSLSHLESYRAENSERSRLQGVDDLTTHVTRMWPKRSTELLNGGSLYWVIKGVVLARQKILRFEERIGADGIRRCAIIMSPEIIKTEAATRRPFQGWRYLKTEDAPPDLTRAREFDDELPSEMNLALAAIGLR
jgi:hypothetical protein